MENRTKFNLSNSINNWKSILSKNPNMTNDNLTELECHLYDEIATLKNLGLNEEEAFIISRKRIGSIDCLINEYSKVNKSTYFINTVYSYIKGVLIFLAFIALIELIPNIILLGAKKMGVNDNYFTLITISLLSVFTILFFTAFFKKYRYKKTSFYKLIKVPVLVSMIIIFKLLTVIITPFTLQDLSMHNYSNMAINLSVLKIAFVAIILIISCVLFYRSKKGSKNSLGYL